MSNKTCVCITRVHHNLSIVLIFVSCEEKHKFLFWSFCRTLQFRLLLHSSESQFDIFPRKQQSNLTWVQLASKRDVSKTKTEDRRPFGLKRRPTGLKQRRTGLRRRPTGLKRRPTGLKRRPTGLKQRPLV